MCCLVNAELCDIFIVVKCVKWITNVLDHILVIVSVSIAADKAITITKGPYYWVRKENKLPHL